MRENLAGALRLLLVTDDRLVGLGALVATCQAAVEGGVTAVQLRLKSVSDAELLEVARQLVGALSVPVLINDRLDVALAAGAAGVHLGADDLPPDRARGIVPDGFIIGSTVGDAAEAVRGQAADYWGIGPLHATATKDDAGVALGFAGARSLLALGGGTAGGGDRRRTAGRCRGRTSGWFRRGGGGKRHSRRSRCCGGGAGIPSSLILHR